MSYLAPRISTCTVVCKMETDEVHDQGDDDINEAINRWFAKMMSDDEDERIKQELVNWMYKYEEALQLREYGADRLVGVFRDAVAVFMSGTASPSATEDLSRAEAREGATSGGAEVDLQSPSTKPGNTSTRSTDFGTVETPLEDLAGVREEIRRILNPVVKFVLESYLGHDTGLKVGNEVRRISVKDLRKIYESKYGKISAKKFSTDLHCLLHTYQLRLGQMRMIGMELSRHIVRENLAKVLSRELSDEQLAQLVREWE